MSPTSYHLHHLSSFSGQQPSSKDYPTEATVTCHIRIISISYCASSSFGMIEVGASTYIHSESLPSWLLDLCLIICPKKLDLLPSTTWFIATIPTETSAVAASILVNAAFLSTEVPAAPFHGCWANEPSSVTYPCTKQYYLEEQGIIRLKLIIFFHSRHNRLYFFH